MQSLISYAIESREQSKAPVTISSRFASTGESGPKHTGQARTSIAWARTGPLTKGCRDSIILRLVASTRIPRFYFVVLVPCQQGTTNVRFFESNFGNTNWRKGR